MYVCVVYRETIKIIAKLQGSKYNDNDKNIKYQIVVIKKNILDRA